MTDAILSENGKWYLPYQPHATEQQFKQAFPNAKKYFEVKNKLDSLHRFNNKLLAKYNPYVQKKIESERNNIKGYFRDEGQTILTVPEWYLVFNPKEYADFLASGENPSEFPFYASIDEYWKLYDRSQQLVSEAYPVNSEYNTMLQVIGVSVTLEYTLKMLYENTIGELFSWFSNDSLSAQEQTITEAHKAYSDFIYHTAWYEFDFLPWIGKVWKANDSGNANWLRKWERTLLFTTEFFVKAGYAKLIEWGAKASYEEPVTNIYMLVSTQEPIHLLKDITLVKKQDEKQLIGITRWGAFTETMKALSNKEIKIHEISGNKSIVVSLLTTHSQLPNFSKAELLYESAVVTETSTRRLVFIVPVDKLLSFIEKAKQQMIEVEHVYDY